MRNLVALVLLTLCAAPALAQDPPPDDFLKGIPGLDLPGFNAGGGVLPGEEAKFSASFSLLKGERSGTVSVTVKIAPNWHIYSVTQSEDGIAPQKSEIISAKGEPFQITGPFVPNVSPELHPSDVFDVPEEYHEGEVTWTAPIQVAEGFQPESASLKLQYAGQVCTNAGTCIPLNEDLEATFAEYVDAVDVGAVKPGEEAQFSASFVLEEGKRTGAISVVAKIAPGWHVYSVTQSEEGIAPQKSEILPGDGAPFRITGPFLPSVPPEVHSSDVYDVSEEYHEFGVTWTAPIEVNEGYSPEGGVLPIRFSGQVCTSGGSGKCIPLNESLEASFVKYVNVLELGQALPPQPLSSQQLLKIVGLALLGGLLLNLMPCVLPVIGLKVFGFMEQAGENRGKILTLNLWYTAGLISVFLILATLAAFLNLGWGEQFTHTWFKVGMSGLVFAMALSFLGVWELPLPGFVGTGATVKLQQTEGAAGAFFKGVFTTILATPCSGPFLGPLFGYTLSQPPFVTYLIFACIGLGMASPYILIGFFPAAIRLLPKPGAWMETFKQFMGFLLLGTVVFLFTTISKDYFVATLSMLFAIWFACWWIGRAMYTTSQKRKVIAWIGGTAFATIVGWGSFAYLTPQKELLEWREYSPVALEKAQAEGKTIMVDFTADWCLTCKINLRNAINTKNVQQVVEENGVVPMLADWTEPNPQIKAKLEELRSRSIPVLAIYPAGKPEEVIVLRDLLTETQVVEALKRAGRSELDSAEASATTSKPAWFVDVN